MYACGEHERISWNFICFFRRCTAFHAEYLRADFSLLFCVGINLRNPTPTAFGQREDGWRRRKNNTTLSVSPFQSSVHRQIETRNDTNFGMIWKDIIENASMYRFFKTLPHAFDWCLQPLGDRLIEQKCENNRQIKCIRINDAAPNAIFV